MIGGHLSYGSLDAVVVVLANLANVLVVVVFLGRAWGRPGVSHAAGIPLMLLAPPMAAAAILNAVEGRAWWLIWLPVPFVLYCAMELWLDYLHPSDFRHSRVLGPYLLLFYVAMIALVGYGFAVSRGAGFVTLGTYFLGLAATGYSYSRVGHGEGRGPSPADRA